MEDTHIDTRKHSPLLDTAVHRSSVSPRDNFHGQTEKVMQSNEVMESDDKCEPSLQTSLEDDADESEVEEDVKVCDICGDAGREDLLAVCSRCTDGAEHTYCMREMLDKVPEGDWLCEECKSNEEQEARRQEHMKLVGGYERSKSLGRTSSVNSEIPFKLDRKDSFCEPSKAKSVSLSKQLSSKRSGDVIEAGPTAKKQVFESSSGSPTALSPSRVPVLSKDSSFKNLDKAKVKQTNQCLTGMESAGDSSENTQSPTKNAPHNLKGNYLKSNSFGSSSSKANVKVAEEAVQKQKQKQSVDANDGPGKLIGKSTSFKGLGRSSVGEPKVKMLSPKCAPVQELKGHKQVRERSSFERKNTIKLDSIPVQSSANSTKRLPRVDSISNSSVSNSRDYKNAQSDGKLISLSKQTSVNKSPDAMATLGEAKRISSTNSRGAGTSISADAKPISSKDGPIINSSRTADGSLVANGVKVDVNDSQGEKSLENNVGRSRQGVNGALVSGNRRGLSSDASISRVKEGIREENRLKAAIEAALQKKQHIFNKNKIPEKPNELPMSITQGIHSGDTVLNQEIDSIPEEAVPVRDAGISNHILNPSKPTSITSAKQFKVYPADFVVNSEEDSVPSVSAIPELEAVWQGGFEIHRNGKLPDVCGGFQAHLSSFASGKVLEVVKKLPSKIVLSEISRPCAWPFQFKEVGAQEDNIALYFFAKDLDSYMRSYKILLEYMMKHDLAFRGNVNGFELLVFPSNHLSHKSQRWNTLFFMWGVFRGRRARCPEERRASLERPEIPVSISNTAPRVKDVAEAATENVSVTGTDTVVSRCETPFSEGPALQKSGSLPNGEYYDQGCSVGRTCSSSPANQGNLEKIPESYSPVLGAEACSESGAAALVDHSQLDPNVVVQHQLSTQEIDSGNSFHESKKSLSVPMLEKQDDSSRSSEKPVVKQEDCSVAVSGKQVPCTVNNNVDENAANSLNQEVQGMDDAKIKGSQVKPEITVDQEEGKKDSIWKKYGDKLKWEGSLKREGYVDINVSADDSLEDLHSLPCSPKRSSAGDLNKPTSEAASVIPCPKRPLGDNKVASNDGDQTYTGKRIKGSDSFNGCERRILLNSPVDTSAAETHDVSTSSRIEDTANEAVDEKLTSVNPGSAERCFFLVDSHAGQSVLSEDRPSPWKVSLLGNEDRLPDGSPNLELALGVEKKQSRKGVLPFFAGIVDSKGPDRPPDITSPKEVDEDASASLSLSLAFPFSDQENPARSEKPLTAVEQAIPARREANSSLLLFRGSSGK